MTSPDVNQFTSEERATIRATVDILREGGLLGGQASSFRIDGAELISVMPIDDGPALYIIGKERGHYYMLDRDGRSVAKSRRLEEVLAALP